MKSGEMEHEMTLFHTMKPIEMFCSRHIILKIVTIYMVSCGHLLTQDDAEHLECVIGYATSLYLVMKVNNTMYRMFCCVRWRHSSFP